MKCTREQEDKIRKIVPKILVWGSIASFVIGFIFLAVWNPSTALNLFIIFALGIALLAAGVLLRGLIDWLNGEINFCTKESDSDSDK